MKADDLFANHVHIGRPVPLELFLVRLVSGTKADGAEVIDQRVEPNIDHVLGIARNWNPPLESAAADGKIAQPAFHEGDYFVAPGLRTNKLRMVFVVGKKFFGKRRQFEIVVLFAHRFRGPSALRAGIARLGRIHIKLVIDAILPGIGTGVDEALRLHPAEEFLYAALVPGLSGADEIVVSDVHPIKETAKFSGNLINPFLWRYLGSGGRALNVDAMLIRPGQKKRVVAEHALAARDGVAHNTGISVPNVRARVHVKNRRCNIKLLFLPLLHLYLSFLSR